MFGGCKAELLVDDLQQTALLHCTYEGSGGGMEGGGEGGRRGEDRECNGLSFETTNSL